VSRQAIAAALAREGLSTGERLVAFSLASFADRDRRARPGTPAAAGRAALEKSWFLDACGKLKRLGLVVVEEAATGRGRASTLRVAFADAGPWWEGEINAELFEAVLGYSRARGSARLLLAAMAALANEQRVVEGVTTSQLCAAAGLSNRTYRRAQSALLRSGELVLRSGMGGRGNTNRWEIADPRCHAGDVAPVGLRRVPPLAGQRPLVASMPSTRHTPGPSRTVSHENRPVDAGVSRAKGATERTLSPVNRPASAGVSGGNGGADRTVSPETPAKTPAKTPAPNGRAGKEPQNPRTIDPPNPPEGGSHADQVVVEETYLTERSRRRRRPVTVDLADVCASLRAAGKADQAAWEQMREQLLEAVGESTFEIWLAHLQLIAVDRDERLVVETSVDATRSWVRRRFDRLIERCAARVGRAARFAEEHERLAVSHSSGLPSYRSTHQSSDKEAYTQNRRVS
jgi:DnaA N-terminal domain